MTLIIKLSIKNLLILLRDAFVAFNKDNAPRLGAALSFYAISSIGPLLVLLVSIAGFVLHDVNVQDTLISSLQNEIGSKANVGEVLGPLIQSVSRPDSNLLGSIISTVLLFFAATGLFSQLQVALNALWGAEPSPITGFWAIVRTRLIAFALVLMVILLIITFLVANTVLSALAARLSAEIGGGAFWLKSGTFFLSVSLFTLLFAVIYKYLPDIHLPWSDVWVGATVSAFLFAVGQVLIGFYFGRFGGSSIPGAVGTLVVLLLWIYYSAQLVFFGAELTWVYSQKFGSQARLNKKADKDIQQIEEYAASEYSSPLPRARKMLWAIVFSILALATLPILWLYQTFSRGSSKRSR